VRGSLEEDGTSMIKKSVWKERGYELGGGKATGTLLGVRSNGVRVACS
jgi:hypothetical protein